MEIAESIGFIHFWGFTPSINFLKDCEGEVNILLTGTGDPRHIIKSLSEQCIIERNLQINLYLQQNHREVLARSLLLLYLLNQVQLPIRERMELFLDVYGNALNRQRTTDYISMTSKQLTRIITQHRQQPPVSSLFDLSALKFKDRDQLEEVFKSWDKQVDFDMGGLRDQRLRHHYKERYDFRTNLIDWDYQWYLKEVGPQINYRWYREWRQTGVAFEFRLATYTSPNRTLSAYVPGQKKRTRESVMVRGYWGDIVMSPYWGFGIEVDCCQSCHQMANKTANTERVHHSQDISEYLVTRGITMLETLQDYHFPPENDKMIKYRKMWKGEEVKQEEDVEEVEIQQVENQGVLQGFSKLNVKIFPVLDSLTQMAGKSKYRGFFHKVVTGSASGSDVAQVINTMTVQNAEIIVETLNNLIILNKEEKAKGMEGLRGIAGENGWQEVFSDHNFVKFIKS